MTKAIINESVTFELTDTAEGTLVNDILFDADIQPISENHFHILKDNRSFNAEVVDVDVTTKTYQLKINGTLHTVQLKDKTDLLLEKMGFHAGVSSKMNVLKAPMPGLIYDIKAKVGDTVNKGDVLLILVAMKMENAIKAAGDGKVKEIKVNLNDSVEKNQVLMTFE